MKNRKTKIFVWMLIGLFLTTIAIQFRLSGTVNFDHFYDVGRKFIVSYEYYTMSYEGLTYGSDGIYQVDSNDTEVTYVIESERNRFWNYVYLNLRDIEETPLHIKVISRNVKGEIISETEIDATDGMNEIYIGSDRRANAVTLKIQNQQGSRFRIESLQIRERKSYYNTGKVLVMLGVGMLLYILVTVMMYQLFFKKLHFQLKYHPMDILVSIYGKVEHVLVRVSGNISEKTAGKIRQVLFFFMIVLMLWTENYGEYNKWDYYKYYLLINCILFFFIGLVSARKKRSCVNWKNPLMIGWLVYSVMTCISDIIVPKTQPFTGVMMLVIFGFVYYVVSCIKRPIIILYDFMSAVSFSYVVTSIFCILCRPITIMAEGRYNGMTISPYSYAMYLGIVIAVFCAELDRCFLEKRNIYRIFFYMLGIISAVYFMWVSGSRDGLLAMLSVILISALRSLLMWKYKTYRIGIVKAVVIGVIVFIPVVWLQDFCIHNIPTKLGTTVIFKNDMRVTEQQDIDEDTLLDRGTPVKQTYVYAMENEQEPEKRNKRFSLQTPSLDILSSGRITIYKEYIANMNLWGHEKDPYIWGRKMRAHNAILQTGYRYGIFAMIPYTLMLLYVIYYAWIYMKKNWMRKKAYAMLPILLAISCFIMMMLDNVERNFRYLPWIVFYLLIGLLGNTRNE